MARTKSIRNNFPLALRTLRTSQKLSQEDFSLASSRTYVSALERGIYSPSLNKVDELAEVLAVHPLALLTLSYLKDCKPESAAVILQSVLRDLSTIDAF